MTGVQTCALPIFTYIVKKVANATGYDWSFNRGSSSLTQIMHPESGENDTIVQVKYLSGFTKDSLIVKTISGCGVSATAKVLVVTATLPSAPGSITETLLSNLSSGCVRVYQYVAPKNTVGAGYDWSFTGLASDTAGTSVTYRSSTGDTIQLTFTKGRVSKAGDSVKVRHISGCGVSAYKSLYLKIGRAHV